MQERDSVSGEIKWSIIPLALNNTYILATNLMRFYRSQAPDGPSSPSSCSSAKNLAVNREKLFYGIVWYVGTMIGYGMMESQGQGLAIRSSADMLQFTASETLFMVSMGMCYFYGWQTYAQLDSDIEPVAMQEVVLSFTSADT